ncbi:MAG: helix-turn-helix domain-containing GNAT family N-acetyltransferase [Geminicoccaceae bacterium]
MQPSADRVEAIRGASRRLVRELGFMRGSLAGTDLPPSAVHALIEIDSADGITAKELAERLLLEKSSVSRLLRKLVAAGEVVERAGARDGRSKPLWLGDRGRVTVAAIHRFARAQVADALGRLSEGQRRTVQEGLRLYADALAGGQRPRATPLIRIETGYAPGLVGRGTALHAAYYARAAGFGQPFEAGVASGLAEFSCRLDRSCNRVWRAMLGEDMVGMVALDGEDLGAGTGHLRWFIVADEARGRGLGRHLLDAALRFGDGQGWPEIRLWTFRGLDAARHLYEAAGFVLAEERPGRRWGAEVMEQCFVRRRA